MAPAGVAKASALAAERGIQNATFEVASVVDYRFEPLSWDVSLFMLVWGKPAGDKTVGGEELAHILGATRRQLVMRADIQRYRHHEPRLEEILEVCRQNDFEAICFSRPEEDQVATHGNLIVANRRGADARFGEPATLACSRPRSWPTTLSGSSTSNRRAGATTLGARTSFDKRRARE